MGLQVECDVCKIKMKVGEKVMVISDQKIGTTSIFPPSDSIQILICSDCYDTLLIRKKV